MKTCPVCGAGAFDDAEVCYGCLHSYKRAAEEARRKAFEGKDGQGDGDLTRAQAAATRAEPANGSSLWGGLGDDRRLPEGAGAVDAKSARGGLAPVGVRADDGACGGRDQEGCEAVAGLGNASAASQLRAPAAAPSAASSEGASIIVSGGSEIVLTLGSGLVLHFAFPGAAACGEGASAEACSVDGGAKACPYLREGLAPKRDRASGVTLRFEPWDCNVRFEPGSGLPQPVCLDAGKPAPDAPPGDSLANKMEDEKARELLEELRAAARARRIAATAKAQA